MFKEKLAEERKEKAEYAKKVGQLTMQVDWLKKKSEEICQGQATRVNLVQNLLTTKEIPASVGAKLLDINRTSIYYKSLPISKEELECRKRLLIICIQTIQLGEQGKCQHN